MTQEELDKVFLLMRQFYPKVSFWEDKNQQLAYRLALEPFTYGDVKASVLNIVRRSKFFPYVSEITEGLVIPAEEEPEREDGFNESVSSALHREICAKWGSWQNYENHLLQLIAELEAK